jgi:hypothetical protein
MAAINVEKSSPNRARSCTSSAYPTDYIRIRVQHAAVDGEYVNVRSACMNCVRRVTGRRPR